MQTATFIMSSLAFVCSAGTLAVMLKTAKELKDAKAKVETDVADVKTKTNDTLGKLRGALEGLEL